MDLEFPPALTSLLSILKKEGRLDIVSQEISQSFEDSVTVLCSNRFCLRILQDRGKWFIELSPKTEPYEWYEIDLINEYITKENGTLTFEEQVAFLQHNLGDILNVMTEGNQQAFKVKIKNLRDDRTKKRFPKWFK